MESVKMSVGRLASARRSDIVLARGSAIERVQWSEFAFDRVAKKRAVPKLLTVSLNPVIVTRRQRSL